MNGVRSGSPSAKRIVGTMVGTFVGVLTFGLFLVYLSPGSDQADEAFGRLLFKVCVAATVLSIGTCDRRAPVRYVLLGLTVVVGAGVPLALIASR